MSQAFKLMTLLILAMLIFSCSGQPTSDDGAGRTEAEQQPVFEDGFESGEADEWSGEEAPEAEAEQPAPEETPEANGS